MFKIRNLPLRGCLAVVGGFLLQLVNGAIFTIGNMSPYIISYLRLHHDPEAKSDDILWVTAALMFGQGSTTFFGSYLEKRLGARISSIIAAVVFSSSVMLTYFALDTNIIVVTIVYGMCQGFGAGLAFYPCMSPGFEWFPNRQGLITGFIMAGFGLGAFVFDQVQTAYINPENKQPDGSGYFLYNDTHGEVIGVAPDVLDNTPKSMLVLGGVYVVLQITGCILIQYPPSHYKKKTEPSLDIPKVPTSWNPSLPPGTFPSNTLQEHSLTTMEAVKTQAFIIMFLVFMLVCAPVAYVMGVFKDYGMYMQMDDKYLALVGAIASVFNVIGKFSWGYACDKLSYRVCVACISGLITIFSCTLPLTRCWNKFMYAIWIWILNINFAGIFVVQPAYCTKTFGPKHSGTIYGLSLTGMAAIGFIVAVLTKYLFPIINYAGMFYLVGAISGIAMLLTLFHYRPTTIVLATYQQNIEKERQKSANLRMDSYHVSALQ